MLLLRNLTLAAGGAAVAGLWTGFGWLSAGFLAGWPDLGSPFMFSKTAVSQHSFIWRTTEQKDKSVCIHIEWVQLVHGSMLEWLNREYQHKVPTFCILILSTSTRNGMMCFSETTFMAVPKARKEASLTSGEVSNTVYNRRHTNLQLHICTYWRWLKIDNDNNNETDIRMARESTFS